MNIIIAGEIAKVSTRADQTLSVHFSTQELNAEESARLFGLKGKFLKAFLTDENIISDAVIEAVTDAEIHDIRKTKTPSQKLRAILFRLWEQEGKPGSSDDYYKAKMQELIDHFHKKLT
jgi:hypothetical protein